MLFKCELPDNSTPLNNRHKLLPGVLGRSREKSARIREDVATLARDYATTSVVRARQLTKYFPVYWSILGSYSERNEYPGLYTDRNYLKLLTDVGLDRASIDKIVTPDLDL